MKHVFDNGSWLEAEELQFAPDLQVGPDVQIRARTIRIAEGCALTLVPGVVRKLPLLDRLWHQYRRYGIRLG